MAVDDATLQAFKKMLGETIQPLGDAFSRFEGQLTEVRGLVGGAIDRIVGLEDSVRAHAKEMADMRRALNSVQASQASSAPSEDDLFGDLNGQPPAKRLFSAVVGGGGGGGLAPAAGRGPMLQPRSSPRASNASSGSGYGAGSEQGGQQPLRIWVGSFGRSLLLVQLKAHSDGILAKAPSGLRSRITVLAYNGNSSYRLVFRSLEDLQEFESCVVDIKLTEWTDARTGETRFIRIKRDRTIEGRKQGRIMAVLFGLVKQRLVDLDRMGGAKLGTAGRVQDTFYVATAEDMWELFKVVRADAAGSDDVEITPFPAALLHWGIDASMAAKFIEATVAEARRL